MTGHSVTQTNLKITNKHFIYGGIYRSFSRNVTELMSAMLVHIRVTCFSKNMQTESKVIILVTSQSKKREKTNHSFILSRHCNSNSDYAKRLDGKVRERYLKKISTIGINPALIEGKHFEPDCLPPLNRLIYFAIWFWKHAFTHKNNLKPSAV